MQVGKRCYSSTRSSLRQCISNVILSWFAMQEKLTEKFECKQRPDIAVYDYDNGKKLLLDIPIAYPWAQNYISRSCTTAEFAAAEQDSIKNK